ncbi:hypothetical protein RI367_007914 [Sorochytrium milnesiophthora]
MSRPVSPALAAMLPESDSTDNQASADGGADHKLLLSPRRLTSPVAETHEDDNGDGDVDADTVHEGDEDGEQQTEESVHQRLADVQQVARVLMEENAELSRRMQLATQDAQKSQATVARFEALLYRKEDELAEQTREVHTLTVQRKALEKKLQDEAAAFDAERQTWWAREEEMQQLRATLTRRAQDSPQLAQVSLTPATSPTPATGRTSPDSPDANGDDIKNAARTIRQQDTAIADLRRDVEELSQTLQQTTLENELLLEQTHALSTEVAQLTELNKSLMEEAEAYQTMLSENAMSGNVPFLSAVISSSAEPAEPSGTAAATSSLADEITNEPVKSELQVLRERNLQLALFMTRIVSRIVEQPGLEELLDQDYDAHAVQAKLRSTSDAKLQHHSSPSALPGSSPNGKADNATTARSPKPNRRWSSMLWSDTSSASKPATSPSSPPSSTSKRSSWFGVSRRTSLFNYGSSSPPTTTTSASSPLAAPTSPIAESPEEQAGTNTNNVGPTISIDVPTPLSSPPAVPPKSAAEDFTRPLPPPKPARTTADAGTRSKKAWVDSP